MSATTTSTFNAFRATGAELRALVAQGHAGAIAEVARRNAKPAKTVAACVSRGLIDEANARIAAAQAARKAKPQVAALLAAQAPQQPAFALVQPTLEPVKGKVAKRDTIAAVRSDMGILAGNVERLATAVGELSRAVSARMVA